MKENAELLEAVDAIRKSTSAKGRSYSGTGIEPQWLATEIMEYCKTQGWESTFTSLPGGRSWLVLTGHVAALVEGNPDEFSVKVEDQNPVKLKTALASTGLLALTGAGVVALPLAGWAAWRSHARTAKVNSIIEFIDSRVAPQAPKPTPMASSGASVADRLRELATLRDQGLITDDEYDAKKQELVKAL